MSYIVKFYSPDNEQNIPSGWPAELRPFNPPPWISGSGFQLTNGSFFSGELTEEYINQNKPLLGVPEDQAYFTNSSYGEYLAANQASYNEWRTGLQNHVIRQSKIIEIKKTAQDRIVSAMGMSPEDSISWIVKQLNMIAKGAQLSRREAKGILTPMESGMLNQLEGFFTQIEAVRSYSNQLEAQVNSGQNVDINAGWPL